MANNAYLTLIKKLLRISSNALDDVINFNINACLTDLTDAGVDIVSGDEKVTKAVELYCKWQMNHNGEADRYERNYQMLSDTMSKQEPYILEDDSE